MKKTIVNPTTGETMDIKITPELQDKMDDYKKMAEEHEAMGHDVYRSMFGCHHCITCEVNKEVAKNNNEQRTDLILKQRSNNNENEQRTDKEVKKRKWWFFFAM